MSESGLEHRGESIRLDRLLVYLRIARTRSAACAMIEGHAFRRNRMRVTRVSENIVVGDVLTFMQGDIVRIVEVLALPDRRASPSGAKQYYREHGLARDDTAPNQSHP